MTMFTGKVAVIQHVDFTFGRSGSFHGLELFKLGRKVEIVGSNEVLEIQYWFITS